MTENTEIAAAKKAAAPKAIFFSYGHDDNAELVKRIEGDLQARGHKIWLDEKKIAAWQNWRLEITEGIRGSQMAIAFLSEHSVSKTGVCREEVAMALQQFGFVGPVDLEGIKADDIKTLSHIQFFDFSEWQKRKEAGHPEFERYYQSKLDELIKLIEGEYSVQSQEVEELRDILQPETFESIFQKHLGGFLGRGWLFDEYKSWRDREEGSRVLWLKAEPGFGKSAFCVELFRGQKGDLAGYWFCDHQSEVLRDPKRFISTIAFQLAQQDGWGGYRKQLMQQLQELPKKIRTSPENKDEGPTVSRSDPVSIRAALRQLGVVDLFRELLAEPLAKNEARPSKIREKDRCPCIILVDGLDEASSPGGVNTLAQLLATRLPQLPSWLRLVVTSREVESVMQHFRRFEPVALAAKEEDIRQDLYAYCSKQIEDHKQKLPPGASREAIINALVGKAGRSILYLRMLFDDKARVKVYLSDTDKLPNGMQAFYADLFSRLFEGVEDAERPAAQAILETIVASREPMSAEELCRACDMGSVSLAMKLVDVFKSLLLTAQRWGHGRSAGSIAETYQLTHKSIADWLISPEAGIYRIALVDGEKRLERFCLSVLNQTDDQSWYARRNAISHWLPNPSRWPDIMRILRDLSYIADRIGRAEGGMLLDDYARVIDARGRAGDGKEAGLQNWTNPSLDAARKVLERNAGKSPGSGALVNLKSAEEIEAIRQRPPTDLEIIEQFRRFVRDHLAAAEAALDTSVFLAQQAYNSEPTGPLHEKGQAFIAKAEAVFIAKSWVKGDMAVDRLEPCRRTIPTRSRAITLSWSLEDNRLAIGQQNGEVRILTINKGEIIKVLISDEQERRSSVISVDLSSDSKTVVAAHNDGFVRMWDIETEACQWAFENPARGPRSNYVRLSADKQTLVTAGSGGGVSVWDVETREKRYSLEGACVERALAMTADGQHIAFIRGQNKIEVWSTADRRRKLSIQGADFTCLALSADGAYLVSGDKAGRVRLWDIRQSCEADMGQEDCLLECNPSAMPVAAVTITPDGSRFAAAGEDKKIYVWNAGEQRPVRVLTGSLFPVSLIEIHPLGHELVSAGRESCLRIWDFEERDSNKATGFEVKALTASADGHEVFAALGNGGLENRSFFDPKDAGQSILTHQQTNHIHVPDFWGVWAMRNRKEICVAGRDKIIEIRDYKVRRRIKRFKGEVEGRSFPIVSTLDDQTIITTGGSQSKTICLWDKRTGKCIEEREGHSGPVRSLVLLPGGDRFVSAGHDKTIVFWRMNAAQPEQTISNAHAGHIHAIACSPDGRHLASGGQDRKVTVWDIKTRERCWSQERHGRALVWVAFSADAQWLWSACWEGVVNIWNIKTQEVVASAWMPGLSKAALLGSGPSAAIGTINGEIFRVAALNLKHGPLIATAQRSERGLFGARKNLSCPACQSKLALSQKAGRRIDHWQEKTGDGGFADTSLAMTCRSCKAPVRINPFWGVMSPAR